MPLTVVFHDIVEFAIYTREPADWQHIYDFVGPCNSSHPIEFLLHTRFRTQDVRLEYEPKTENTLYNMIPANYNKQQHCKLNQIQLMGIARLIFLLNLEFKKRRNQRW